jgi:hypothetical protein
MSKASDLARLLNADGEIQAADIEDGVVTAAKLASTLDLSGKTITNMNPSGIYLGGTGAANYLDDYEEGTWTPTLTASGYTFTHTAQYGFYTKVGNLVTVKLYMIASYSSGSGTAVGGIYGLPFQSGSSYANYGGGSWFPDTGSQFFSRTGAVRTQRNATFLRLGNGFGGSTLQSNFDWSTMPSSMEFEISAQYFTD